MVSVRVRVCVRVRVRAQGNCQHYRHVVIWGPIQPDRGEG